MDLYLVDPNTWQPTDLIDDYESLVWTDRYCKYGDFTLMVKSRSSLVKRLASRKYLRIADSTRIMQIETLDNNHQSAEGTDLIKISGRSLEQFLMHRAFKQFGNTAAKIMTGTPAEIAVALVNEYCVDPTTVEATSIIPGLDCWDVTTNGLSSVTLNVQRGTVYDAVMNILEPFGLGWYIDSDGPSLLDFAVYNGVDRTDPTTGYYTEYSADNDNLLNTSTLESVSNFKNHVRVLGAKAYADAYALGTDPSVSGFDRRTLILDATDIGTDSSTTVAQDQAALQRRAMEALADINNRYVRVVDGDIPQNNWSKVAYGLGDLVVVKDNYENRAIARITETVWSSDKEGEKRSPTFDFSAP